MKRDAAAELRNVREVERLRKKNDTQAKRIVKYREIALKWKAVADTLAGAHYAHNPRCIVRDGCRTCNALTEYEAAVSQSEAGS